MENEWSIIKDYIPVIVVIISSILAYIIGKSSEKNKKYTSMSEESVSKFLANMYSDVIEITNVKKYDIESIQSFVESYSKNAEIYKIYDDILINEIFKLSIKINTTEIDDEQLAKYFNGISEKIEKLYWERYIVNTEGFNWFAATKTTNPWFSLTGSFFLKIRKTSEYTSIILAMVTYLVLVESIINRGEELFSFELAWALVILFLVILGIYFLMNGISVFFDRNPKIKDKHNIKDYQSSSTQPGKVNQTQ